MRYFVALIMATSLFISCNKNSDKKTNSEEKSEIEFSGHYDNFLQYWLENTKTDIHRVETEENHRHLSVNIKETNSDEYSLEIREGRNGKTLVESIVVTENDLTQNVKKIGDTIYVSNLKHFENKTPYKFIKTRKFSGWIEVPLEQYGDSTYRKSNLEIHDQGGMAEIDIDGVQYTAELTQLLFGKRLAIMKLAIYNMPLDRVGINSRSISYTWSNPDSKRIGINLRKVVSGWTFIEPGYINSDNTNFKKK